MSFFDLRGRLKSLVLGILTLSISTSYAQDLCYESTGRYGAWLAGSAALLGGLLAVSSQKSEKGTTGTSGDKGPHGDRGPRGVEGPLGTLGATGCPGAQGGTGMTGATGPLGVTGATGPQGVEGPSIFEQEEGSTLLFFISLNISDTAGATITFSPFVSTPDGTVIEGINVTTNTNGLVVFAPIPITDPEFGTYTFGVNYELMNVGMTPPTLDQFNGSVVASRNGLLTNVQFPITLPLVLGTLNSQSQLEVDYTFAPAVVP